MQEVGGRAAVYGAALMMLLTGCGATEKSVVGFSREELNWIDENHTERRLYIRTVCSRIPCSSELATYNIGSSSFH